MFTGKMLKQVTDKFMTAEASKEARVQVLLPNGDFMDINGMKLLQNKLIGVRESHRLVFTVTPEKWKMGKVIKKL